MKRINHIVYALDTEGKTHTVTVLARPHSVTVERIARVAFKAREIDVQTILAISKEQ